MDLKEFIFIIRKPDGQEHEMSVSAQNETDAIKRVNSLLDITHSSDKVIAMLKGSKIVP